VEMMFVCLLLFLAASMAVGDGTNREVSQDAGRLFNNLMANYQKQVAPDMSKEPVMVKFGLNVLDIFDMDLESGYGKFLIWENMEWSDDRLGWDPKEYGVHSLSIDPNLLWVPDITLYKSKISDDKMVVTKAVLFQSGVITWIPITERAVPCVKNETLHGEIVCTFRYGSWTMDGLKVDPQPTYGFNSDNFATILPYNIEEATNKRNVMKYDCCPEPYIDLEFTLRLTYTPEAKKEDDE